MRCPLVGVATALIALAATTGCSTASEPTGMFDPCAEIPDSAIRDAGFDPGTEKNVDSVTGDSVTCMFSPAGGSGTLRLEHPNALALPRTYERYLATAQSVADSPGGASPTVTTINGRDAYIGPSTMLGCAVTLRTATSALTVHVGNPYGDTCSTARYAATALEPSIGDR